VGQPKVTWNLSRIFPRQSRISVPGWYVLTIPVSSVHSLNTLVAAANAVFEALNASTAGNLAQKRRRIELQIGLRRQVV
jgi:hypothetical protein